jgi:predicted DNA-binding protein (MmcQ/YjbR family)
MTIEALEQICDQFPYVTKDIKWETHLCFNVGGKMFMITSPDEYPPTAAFKVSEEEFEEIASKDGFKPAPHLGRYKWIHVDDISRLSVKQWQHYTGQSYNLVYAKLAPKAKKALLG